MFITSRAKMSPLYFSEILLLTKTKNEQDFIDWLEWHINVIHFHHIVVFDNDSPIDIKSICAKYSQVEYNKISGWPNQYKLYNEYVNGKCKSQWCIPIDDDEFIFIGDKYNNNVNVFLQEMSSKHQNCKKISLAWKNMFSKEPIETRKGSLINCCNYYSHEASNVWQNHDGWVKTFVNGRYEWEYVWNRKGRVVNSGHNPSTAIPSYLENGHVIAGGEVEEYDRDNDNAWIAHYQYKSRSEWEWKCKNRVSAANRNFDKDRVELYDKIYEIGGMREENALKNLWREDEEVETIEEKVEEVEVEKVEVEEKKELKVALCAIAKNENLYIREWVEYYKNLGIAHIFLYDNNELDGERFEDTIGDYIDSGYVEVIDVRGVEKGCVYINDKVNLQNWCYIKCYEDRCKDFDWVCFFDIDEFLYFKEESLQSFLSDKRITKDVGTILVPWIHYDDNDLIEYDPRPVLERFTRESDYLKAAVKSIVRCNFIVDKTDEEYLNFLHSFKLSNMKFMFSNFLLIDQIEKKNWYIIKNKEDINKCKCILKHFKTKSLEEFLERHVGRHWGTGKKYTDNTQSIDDIIIKYKEFCKWNDEKENFSKNFNSVTVFIASLYNDCLVETLKSIEKQSEVYEINLSANNFTKNQIDFLKKSIKKKLVIHNTDNRKKSFEKIKFADNCKTKYIAFCDDDLIYPNFYFKKMISKLNELESPISYHGGKFLQFPIKSYYKDRKMFSFSLYVKDDIEVDVIGNGVSLFKRDWFNDNEFSEMYKNAPEISMDDIFISKILKDKGFKLYVIQHNKNEVIEKYKNKDSVYNTYKNKDIYQTNWVNDNYRFNKIYIIKW